MTNGQFIALSVVCVVVWSIYLNHSAHRYLRERDRYLASPHDAREQREAREVRRALKVGAALGVSIWLALAGAVWLIVRAVG